MKHYSTGLSLIELLTTLSLLSILSLASISFADWIQKIRLETTVRQLHSEIQLAKTVAIKQQKLITVCGSVDGESCVKQWQDGELLLFEDKNFDRLLDASDTLIRRVELPSMQVTWRGSNRNYMRARANGTLIEWGRYTVCHPSESGTAIQLTYNRMGRAYSEKPAKALLAQQGLCQN